MAGQAESRGLGLHQGKAFGGTIIISQERLKAPQLVCDCSSPQHQRMTWLSSVFFSVGKVEATEGFREMAARYRSKLG